MPRDIGDLLLTYLPKFLDSDEWRWLTESERTALHLTLGTTTTWVEKEIRAGRGAAVTGYASLLEDLASSGNPLEANAVVIDSLEALDWSDPQLGMLLKELGPNTRALLGTL
jgi:hypothetical protein